APATTDTDNPVAPAAGFVVFPAFPMACHSVPFEDRAQFAIQCGVEFPPLRARSEHNLPVQPILLVMRADGLPELVIDDPQFRHLPDDPFRRGVEPGDTLAG